MATGFRREPYQDNGSIDHDLRRGSSYWLSSILEWVKEHDYSHVFSGRPALSCREPGDECEVLVIWPTHKPGPAAVFTCSYKADEALCYLRVS